MPVIKKVTVQERKGFELPVCVDCNEVIRAGNEAVKDRKDKKKGTVYHHTTCYKAKT
jgi:hypothetical protein